MDDLHVLGVVHVGRADFVDGYRVGSNFKAYDSYLLLFDGNPNLVAHDVDWH